MVDQRSDDYQRHAGNFHFYVGKWLDEREPNGDNHLYSYGHQRGRLEHGHRSRNHHRKRAEQANDQLLYGQPWKHRVGFQQHAELGYERGDEYRDYAGNIHVRVGKRFDEREPNGNNDLYPDGDKCDGVDHLHGKSHGDSFRWPIVHHYYFVPGRDTRRGVCRMHHSRHRWISALYLFGQHES